MDIDEAEALLERDGCRQKIRGRSSRYAHPNPGFVRKSCRNKRRYHTEEEATTQRRWIERKIIANGQTPDPTRCYRCAVCNGFHLTGIVSQEPQM